MVISWEHPAAKKFRKDLVNSIAEDLNMYNDISKLEKLMEEMAGAPREKLGKRQPGETCSYERPRRDVSLGTEVSTDLRKKT